MFADLGVEVEVKNQARVHTWYEDYFGYPYPALQSAQDGIRRFLVAGTCVALRPAPDGLQLDAPYSLADIYAGVLRPNAQCNHRPLFLTKARHYQARWPWLRIETEIHA